MCSYFGWASYTGFSLLQVLGENWSDCYEGKSFSPLQISTISESSRLSLFYNSFTCTSDPLLLNTSEIYLSSCISSFSFIYVQVSYGLLVSKQYISKSKSSKPPIWKIYLFSIDITVGYSLPTGTGGPSYHVELNTLNLKHFLLPIGTQRMPIGCIISSIPPVT